MYGCGENLLSIVQWAEVNMLCCASLVIKRASIHCCVCALCMEQASWNDAAAPDADADANAEDAAAADADDETGDKQQSMVVVF